MLMIWLASFPRSGNTFFRNVLFEVYGIPSSTYHLDPNRQVDDGYAGYDVVKTHLLPENLPAEYQDVPAVYLVRDGRDALLSIAHHRKDIVNPGSDLYTNLLEAILAQGGSFFGGWARNVSHWTAKAAIVIRFEDLIADPIREVEKLRAIMPLPPPQLDKLPDFKSLKFGQPKYGGGGKKNFNSARNQKHFRSGKVGGWKAEMAPELIELLMNINGPVLKQWGYAPDWQPYAGAPTRVMLECSKLYGQDNDGVKRYLTELVNALSIVLPHYPQYELALYDRKSVQPLVHSAKREEEGLPEQQFRKISSKEAILTDRRTMGYEKIMLLAKDTFKWIFPKPWYDWASDHYRKGPFRSYLHRLKLLARRWKFQENEQAVFAKIATADLIHLPLPQHFQELPDDPPPVLCTIHDLTDALLPEYHDRQNVELARLGIQTLESLQAHLLAVSQSTARDIENHLSYPPERISMVYEGVNHTLFHPRNRQEDIGWLRQRYQVPPDRPFFLCLSTIEPRKNLGNMIRAFLLLKDSHPDIREVLLICGKSGWKTDEVFKDVDLNHPDLIFTGFVDDVHLPHFYAHATALCYVSHYEGFGLPMLEAMACATPVIYGDNSSMPELAREGGLAAQADDSARIMQHMHLLSTDPDRWQAMSAAAWREAQRFSWLKTAVQTLSVYRDVVNTAHQSTPQP